MTIWMYYTYWSLGFVRFSTKEPSWAILNGRIGWLGKSASGEMCTHDVEEFLNIDIPRNHRILVELRSKPMVIGRGVQLYVHETWTWED